MMIRVSAIFWLFPLLDASVDTPVVSLAVLAVVGLVSVRRHRRLGAMGTVAGTVGIVILGMADSIGPDAWLASRPMVRWGFSLLVGSATYLLIAPPPVAPLAARLDRTQAGTVVVMAIAVLLAVPGGQVAGMVAIRSEARAIAAWVDAESVATGQVPTDLTGYPWRRAARAEHVRYRPGPAYPIEARLRYRIDVRLSARHPFRSWYGDPGGWRRDAW